MYWYFNYPHILTIIILSLKQQLAYLKFQIISSYSIFQYGNTY